MSLDDLRQFAASPEFRSLDAASATAVALKLSQLRHAFSAQRAAAQQLPLVATVSATQPENKADPQSGGILICCGKCGLPKKGHTCRNPGGQPIKAMWWRRVSWRADEEVPLLTPERDLAGWPASQTLIERYPQGGESKGDRERWREVVREAERTHFVKCAETALEELQGENW